MKLWEWIKIFFSSVYKVLVPFIGSFIAAQAKGLTPIVLEVIAEIAADPNFNRMTWAEKLGEAIPRIQAKAHAIGKQFSVTDILNQIQVLITEQDEGLR